MLKHLLFFSLILLFTSAGRGQEILLTLTDGKILKTKDISIKKNGDILFLHSKINSYMLLPRHLLKKMDYPKPESLKKADLLFRQKKYKESAFLYEKSSGKLKNISPWEEYSIYHAANAILLTGDREKAFELLTAFSAAKKITVTEETREEYCKILLFLAQLYMGKKEYGPIYPLLDKLISSPKEIFAAQALFMKGEALFQEKKFQKSLDCFSLYLLIFPDAGYSKKAEEYCKILREKLSGRMKKE